MDRIEITLTDMGKFGRSIRAFPTGELVPIVVIDPITGLWVIQWVKPVPQPDWIEPADVDYTTIPDEAVQALREPIESLKVTGHPTDLFLVSTDLMGHAEGYEAVGRESAAAVLQTEARALIDLAVSRMP